MNKTIAFVSFESPWFPAGGIAAVMARLPGAVEAASGLPTVVVTPFHEKSARIAALGGRSIGEFSLPYGKRALGISVLHSESAALWYFLRVRGASGLRPAPFCGARHPYDMSSAVLTRDSLLFGAAVVKALPLIASHRDIEPRSVEWNLFAQDWEAATSLLAGASEPHVSARFHLTLHNSYDAFASVGDLESFRIDPAACPGETILQRAIPRAEAPLFTVSRQFALDFTDELLEREVMAPHLQELLKQAGVTGVDNGPFRPPEADSEALRRALGGDFGRLQAWKADSRRAALKALDAHQATPKRPVWGDKGRFRRGEAPWFVMAGRDDPRQKGYDVAVAAIEDYLATHHGQADCAQFLFLPMPGDEGLAGLTFLKSLAKRYPEDVLAFPFIWVEGFGSALKGTAYGLMPSLYEPFGMANELYAVGCVGIARATGGNIEQVVPYRDCESFTPAVEARARRFHASSAAPTGILFREEDGIPTARADWDAINAAGYDPAGGAPSRVQERRAYPLFDEMARQLRLAIEDGIRVYRDPALYYRMLAAGVEHVQATFSWELAGRAYAAKVGR